MIAQALIRRPWLHQSFQNRQLREPGSKLQGQNSLASSTFHWPSRIFQSGTATAPPTEAAVYARIFEEVFQHSCWAQGACLPQTCLLSFLPDHQARFFAYCKLQFELSTLSHRGELIPQYYCRAAQALQNGDIEAAIDLYTELLNTGCSAPGVLINRSLAHSRAGNHSLAIADLQQVLSSIATLPTEQQPCIEPASNTHRLL